MDQLNSLKNRGSKFLNGVKSLSAETVLANAQSKLRLKAVNLMSEAKGSRTIQLKLLVGGILGANSQEDSSNPVFSVSTGALIGAMTGYGLDFSSPTRSKITPPESVKVKYDPSKLAKEFIEGRKITDSIAKLEGQSLRASVLYDKNEKLEEKIKETEKKIEDMHSTYRRGDVVGNKDKALVAKWNNRIDKFKNRIGKNRSRIAGIENQISNVSGAMFDSLNTMSRFDNPSIRNHAEKMAQAILENGQPYSMEEKLSAMKSIISGIANINDKTIAGKMMNNTTFDFDAALTRSVTDQDLNMVVRKDDLPFAIKRPEGSLINEDTVAGDIDQIIEAAIKGNNTPEHRVPGISAAMHKIVAQSVGKGKDVKVSPDKISVHSGSREEFSFPLTKFGDKEEAFVRQGRTIYPVKQMNPLGSLLASDVPFDFTQLGEVKSATSTRVPTARDIATGYTPVEIANFSGANNESSNVAWSLKEYIPEENALFDGNYYNRTGLGETIGRQIELKHTIKPSSVNDKGVITTSGGDNLRKITEVPTNGRIPEMASVIEALSKEYPESMMYGQSQASRKTQIVGDNSHRPYQISPLPNAARSGQGTLDRGFRSGNSREISPGGATLSSATLVNKKVITGEGTIRSAPYMFRNSTAWGDGSTVFNSSSSELRMSDYGKLTIAPVDGRFKLNIDRMHGLMEVLRGSKTPEERRMNLQRYFPDQIASVRNQGNVEDALEEKNYRKASFYQRALENTVPGIPLYPGDTVGYSPTGEAEKIPDYYGKARIHDLEINEHGNLDITYKAMSTPSQENNIKFYSQSMKLAGTGLNKKEMEQLLFLDRAEGLGASEYHFNDSGFSHVSIDVNKVADKSGIDRSGFDFGKVNVVPDGTSISGVERAEGYTTLGQLHERLTTNSITEIRKPDLTKIMESPDLVVALPDSGIENMHRINSIKSMDELKSGEIADIFSKFGISNVMNFKGSGRIESINEGIERGKATGKTEDEILDAAKKDMLGENIFQTYTSEENIAPDIHSTLMRVGRYSSKNPDKTLDSIIQNGDLFSEDKTVRETSAQYVRQRVKDLSEPVGITNPLSADAPLTNMKGFVAIERGAGIHGAGSGSRLSWLAVDSLMKSGLDLNLLADSTENDIGAIHELEMIRQGSSPALENDFSRVFHKDGYLPAVPGQSIGFNGIAGGLSPGSMSNISGGGQSISGTSSAVGSGPTHVAGSSIINGGPVSNANSGSGSAGTNIGGSTSSSMHQPTNINGSPNTTGISQNINSQPSSTGPSTISSGTSNSNIGGGTNNTNGPNGSKLKQFTAPKNILNWTNKQKVNNGPGGVIGSIGVTPGQPGTPLSSPINSGPSGSVYANHSQNPSINPTGTSGSTSVNTSGGIHGGTLNGVIGGVPSPQGPVQRVKVDSKLSKQLGAAIITAMSQEPEKRLEALSKIMDTSDFDKTTGKISYNLTDHAGDLRSVSFSTYNTGRSGITSDGSVSITKEMDKIKLRIVSADMNIRALDDKNHPLMKSFTSTLDNAIQDYRRVVAQAMTTDGKANINKSANALSGKFSEIRVSEAVSGYVPDVVIPHLWKENGGTKSAYNVYSVDQMQEIMDKYEKKGLNKNDYWMKEIKIKTEDGSEPGKKVYQLFQSFEDGSSLPALELSTREPALSSGSSMFKEILITGDNSGKEKGRRSFFVGIPVFRDHKSLEEMQQQMDFDHDTTGNILINNNSKETHLRTLEFKHSLDTHMTETFPYKSHLTVKGSYKEILSLQKIYRIAERRGIPVKEVMTTELTNLARKGTLRKTLTPLATILGNSITGSIFMKIKDSKLSQERANAANDIVGQFIENILKTQKVDTDEAVALVPKIFKSLASREKFLAEGGTDTSYKKELREMLTTYVSLKDDKVSHLGQQMYQQGIDDIVEADFDYGIRSSMKESILDTNAEARKYKMGTGTFFRDLSASITNVMTGSGQSQTIFTDKMRTDIPEQNPPHVGNVQVPLDVTSGKTRSVKDIVVDAVSNKGNRKVVGLGLLGLGLTAFTLGRSSPPAINTDLGQDADRKVNVPSPTASSNGYISKINTPSISVGGMENVSGRKLDRVVYGNNLVTNRVRDNSNNVSY